MLIGTAKLGDAFASEITEAGLAALAEADAVEPDFQSVGIAAE